MNQQLGVKALTKKFIPRNTELNGMMGTEMKIIALQRPLQLNYEYSGHIPTHFQIRKQKLGITSHFGNLEQYICTVHSNHN